MNESSTQRQATRSASRTGAAFCGRRLPSGDRVVPQIAPAGEHQCVVAKAVIEAVAWRKFADNPTGEALRLTLHVADEFFPVQQDISLGNIALLGVVAAAFGTDRYRLNPQELVGKWARINVRHVEKNGRLFAAVGRWVTSPRREQLPQAFEFPSRGNASESPRRKGKRPESGQGDLCW